MSSLAWNKANGKRDIGHNGQLMKIEEKSVKRHCFPLRNSAGYKARWRNVNSESQGTNTPKTPPQKKERNR